ncbi:MAG: PAS domain S-box protein [Fimbriimonas sp.]
MARIESDRKHPPLSPREREQIRLASEGLIDTAIAQHLGISEATVGTYWGRVRIKLGPYNRTELVAIVIREEQEEALERLRKENEETLSQLHNAMSHSHEKGSVFREIVENAPDAMLLVSEQGRISMANQAAYELFGYEPDGLDDTNILSLIPTRYWDVHNTHRLEYVHNPQRRSMGEHLDTPALRRNGEEFRIRASLSAITTPTGLIVMCSIREV